MFSQYIMNALFCKYILIPAFSSDQKISLDDLHKTNLLKEQIITNLREMGIEELFPVQMCVIPHIMTANVVGGDICVSAPTGSGKTLAYAIPIVNVSHSLSLLFADPITILWSNLWLNYWSRTGVLRSSFVALQLHVLTPDYRL